MGRVSAYSPCRLLVIEAGLRLGRYWTKRRKELERQGDIDTLVGSTLALVAFLLVFMIGIATDRYENRRRLVIAEANAIGTTYLRAGYLDEPEQQRLLVTGP
jgi:hypothetical protein